MIEGQGVGERDVREAGGLPSKGHCEACGTDVLGSWLIEYAKGLTRATIR